MAKIYVGNCPYDVTEENLRELFATYGDVETVNVITDRDTGRPRGFAFVEMPDGSAAQAAISGLNGKDLGGRSLNVNEARPKREGGGGGGGRGGGGGGGRGGGGGGGGRRW